MLIVACIPGLLVGCGGGGSSNKVTQPSNLVYPQPTITATVGTAIVADTPTVMGSAATFTVSPTLPAGLALNSSTGAISGTPTAVTAQAAYTVTATNSAGSTTATLQITVNPAPPSNLTYPQMTIMATVGTAITPDTPTVTGTVTGYTVSPTLPAGLTIDGTTGTISGKPTTVTAQAAYTVTASNSVGSTTAVLQIAVNPPPPSSLVYPQTSLSTFVGVVITPDIPTVTGTVTGYTVSPALPAGLSLDPATGAISGAPTAVTAQAPYTVTVSNAGGSTTAVVTIMVSKALNSLLELGHGATIFQMRTQSSRVFSQDWTGHWALWDYSSGAEIAKGDAGTGQISAEYSAAPWPADMEGPTIAVGVANGVEVRSSSDGHLLSIIASPMIDQPWPSAPAWWKLASDGSYICAGSQAGLSVWSQVGQLLISKTGDYSKAVAFAAPGEVRVASGAAGQNVVETISAVDGTSSVGPAFSGQFNSWFLDGERFLTNQGNTVWTYSKTSSQLGIVALPTIGYLTGQGDWIWTFEASYPDSLMQIYPIGSSTPAATYNLDIIAQFTTSGTTVGVLTSGTSSISVIDLSGPSPSKADYTVPYDPLVFAASTSSQWLAGYSDGLVYDGASAATQPRYLTLGAAWSIAGGTGRTAIATASGKIFYFDPAISTLQGSIDLSSWKLALSSDGTILAAAAEDPTAQNQILNIYSLPANTLTYGWPFNYYLTDFVLSGSGTMLGQIISPLSGPYSRQVTAARGGSIVWSDTSPPGYTAQAGTVQVSPDGTLIAATNYELVDNNNTTNIYKNGTLVTAVPGFLVGWIDNSQVLVNTYGYLGHSDYISYMGATIYSSAGAKLATPPLPELKSIQPVTSDTVYSPEYNVIYSVTLGAPTWTSPYSFTGHGAVAGSYVVFQSGSEVVVDNYTQ